MAFAETCPVSGYRCACRRARIIDVAGLRRRSAMQSGGEFHQLSSSGGPAAVNALAALAMAQALQISSGMYDERALALGGLGVAAAVLAAVWRKRAAMGGRLGPAAKSARRAAALRKSVFGDLPEYLWIPGAAVVPGAGDRRKPGDRVHVPSAGHSRRAAGCRAPRRCALRDARA